MRTVRDLLVAAGVTALLFAVVMSLPVLIIGVIVLGIGYLIFAGLHDARLAEERKTKDGEDANP